MANKVVVSGDKITAIADAIRTKTGNSDLMSLDDMPTQIEAIETGGDGEALAQSILDKTITAYSNEKLTAIPDYAFYKADKLATVYLPNVTSIGIASFQLCRNFNPVRFPKCKSIGSSAFANSSYVYSIDFPVLETAGTGCFNSLIMITEVYLPELQAIPQTCFTWCTSLVTAEFLKITSIGANAFQHCSKLASLIIRTDSVCSLVNTNAFATSGVLNKTGYIYVPRNLVDSYKTATNWSAYADQIRAIEDYPEITGG